MIVKATDIEFFILCRDTHELLAVRRLVPPPRGRALPLTPLLAAGEAVFLTDILGHRSARANHLAETLDCGGVVRGILQ